jgi:hypothetical protein
VLHSLPIPAETEAYHVMSRDPVTRKILQPEGIYDRIWAEITECVAPRRCPAADIEKVRQKAAAAFVCPLSSVDVARRTDARTEPLAGLSLGYLPDSLYMAVFLPEYKRQFVFLKSHNAAGFGQGDASVILRTETASFFQAAGCGAWGIALCAMANRRVRTSGSTYENTDDRVCFWSWFTEERA